MTDKEKNELIQEFMGWKLVFMPSIPEHKGGWAFQNQFTSETLPNQYSDSHIPFCSDWNWLMKAIISVDDHLDCNGSDKLYKAAQELTEAVSCYNINIVSNSLCRAIEYYKLFK